MQAGRTSIPSSLNSRTLCFHNLGQYRERFVQLIQWSLIKPVIREPWHLAIISWNGISKPDIPHYARDSFIYLDTNIDLFGDRQFTLLRVCVHSILGKLVFQNVAEERIATILCLPCEQTANLFNIHPVLVLPVLYLSL